jgi:soluble lytic murein transglycosylase-like protein
MQSLFGSGVPGQNDLLQMLAQRFSATQAGLPAQAAPAPLAATPAPPAASGVLNLPNGLGPIVQQAAEKYGVDPALIAGVIQTESAFNPNAVSPAGARGLMQLMPGTARSLGVTNASDPLQNVLGGAKLLGQMLEKYHGNAELALAAYNAGSGNVDKYGGIPPFSETRRYVPTVLANADRFRQPAPTTTNAQAPSQTAQTPPQPAAQTDGRARRS